MAHKRPKKLSDQLRQAIDDSDLTRYRIALESGTDHATLSRFMNHKAGVSVPVLDRLGETLGLELVAKRRPRRVKKGR